MEALKTGYCNVPLEVSIERHLSRKEECSLDPPYTPPREISSPTTRNHANWQRWLKEMGDGDMQMLDIMKQNMVLTGVPQVPRRGNQTLLPKKY